MEALQQSKGIEPISWTSDHNRSLVRNNADPKAGSDHAGPGSSGSAFLMTRFQSYPTMDLHVPSKHSFQKSPLDDLPLLASQLYQSIKAFADWNSINVNLDPDPSKPVSEYIQQLIKTFRKILPKKYDFHVTWQEHHWIHKLDGFTHLTVFKFMDRGWQHMYLIQCDFLPILKQINPKLFRIVCHFIGFLHNSLQVPLWTVNGMAENMFYLEEQLEEMKMNPEHFTEEECIELEEAIQTYKHGAAKEYSDILSDICPTARSMKAMSRSLNPDDGVESMLIRCMDTAWKLSKDKFQIFDFFKYEPGQEDFDGPMIGPDQLLGFVWSLNDPIFTRYESMVMNEANEFGVQDPAYSVTVHPGLNEFLEDTDYPFRFANFLDQLTDTFTLLHRHCTNHD